VSEATFCSRNLSGNLKKKQDLFIVDRFLKALIIKSANRNAAINLIAAFKLRLGIRKRHDGLKTSREGANRRAREV